MSAGRFQNASEAICAGLRLLEQQTSEDQQKLELLRSLAAGAIDELDQGQGIVVKNERQLSSLIKNIGLQASKKAAAS